MIVSSGVAASTAGTCVLVQELKYSRRRRLVVEAVAGGVPVGAAAADRQPAEMAAVTDDVDLGTRVDTGVSDVEEAAPANMHVTAERLLAEELRADVGVHAVGADEDVAGDDLAVGELAGDPVTGVGHLGHLVAEADVLVAERAGDHGVELAAEDAGQRRAVALAVGVDVLVADHLAVAGERAVARQQVRHLGELVLEPEALDDADAVGPDVQADAGGPELRVALVDHHVETGLLEGQAGRQPTYPGATDHSLAGHVFSSWFSVREPSSSVRA